MESDYVFWEIWYYENDRRVGYGDLYQYEVGQVVQVGDEIEPGMVVTAIREMDCDDPQLPFAAVDVEYH
ncbi:MAG: hypothetical protein F6K35_35735 [Okeania sp. SIO2H7]|nr:hypothetical protein [Okeania sp. SIO2H7]